MGEYAVPESIRASRPKGTVVKKIAGHFYVYETCFNKGDAIRIYAIALIHFTQGFVHMKDIGTCYEMSYLSLLWPGLKMGYDAMENLYDQLGRRQRGVLQFEDQSLQASSGQIAIDGHVIASGSVENELAEKGYKFWKLGEAQINLLMAYDVNTGMPLFSRMYEGGSTDGVSVKDLFRQVKLEKTLFIVDRGFYSTENLELFTRDGNAYIIPLRKNHKACQQAVSRLDMLSRFVCQKGRKGSLIECKDEMIDRQRVLTFRDVDEATAEHTTRRKRLNS